MIAEHSNESAPPCYRELTSRPPLVVSHSPCMDGFTAAWACWLKHPDWEYVPGIHGEVLPPELFTDRDVYFLDFSYKCPVMERIVLEANTVTVLDHHVSAQGELQFLFEAVYRGLFDMNHSGAYLAWEWFHPKLDVPNLVRIVEDRDLWRFTYSPHTKPICDAIFSHEYSFEKWNEFYNMLEDRDDTAYLVREGEAIGRKQLKDIKELLSAITYKLRIGQYIVPAANLPYMMSSEAGHILSKDVPFAATYFFNGDKYQFSLRSSETGMDVSEIAKTYHGGGHKHAAGFQVRSLEDL